MIHAAVTDPTLLLASALRRSAAAAGIALEVAALDAEPWASLTFTGQRHRLTVAADAGPPFDAWLARLGSASLAMRGHVADEPAVVAVDPVGGRTYATLEVVTVEDG